MENELTKALDKKFMNAAKFSLEVEKLVLEEKVNYISVNFSNIFLYGNNQFNDYLIFKQIKFIIAE